MIVYKLTNKINGKVYIGITTRGLKRRVREHGKDARCGNNRPLYKAIRKYGMESFEASVLATAGNIDELKVLEINLIKLHGSTFRDRGYNLSLGGESAYGAVRSDATKALLSRIAKARKPRLGIKHTPETRGILSEKAKRRGTAHLIDAYKAAWNDPDKREAMTEQRRGRAWSEETRKKSIATRTGLKRGRTAQTEKMEAVMAVRCGPEHKTILVQRGGKPVCIFCERRRQRESRERKANLSQSAPFP